MRLTYLGRRHAFDLATGDDARPTDEPATAPDVGPRLPYSADVEPAPPPAWDPRMEPYEEQHRRTGFTA